MDAAFLVRRASSADIVAVRSLHDASLEVRYEPVFFTQLVSPTVLCLVACEAGGTIVGVVSARLARSQNVSEEPPEGIWSLVGAALLRVLRAVLPTVDDGALDAPPACYIMTLCVSPAARRRGIARALLCALCAETEADGGFGGGRARSRELHVLHSNAAAIALYEGLGFKLRRTVKNYYFLDGAHHDALLMSDAPADDAATAAETDAGGLWRWVSSWFNDVAAPPENTVESLA